MATSFPYSTGIFTPTKLGKSKPTLTIADYSLMVLQSNLFIGGQYHEIYDHPFHSILSVITSNLIFFRVSINILTSSL